MLRLFVVCSLISVSQLEYDLLTKYNDSCGEYFSGLTPYFIESAKSFQVFIQAEQSPGLDVCVCLHPCTSQIEQIQNFFFKKLIF